MIAVSTSRAPPAGRLRSCARMLAAIRRSLLAVIRSELIKLRRPGVIYGIGGATVLLVALSTVLTFALAKSGPGADDGFTTTLGLLNGSGGMSRGTDVAAGFLGLLVFVMFLVATTAEYGLGTIRVMATRQPNRATHLVGRYAALAAVTAVVIAVAEVVSIALSLGLAGTKDVSTAAWLTGAGLQAAGSAYLHALLAAALYGGLAFALGIALRSTAIALAVGIAWLMPFEHILQNSWAAAARWFPGLSLEAIARGGTAEVSLTHALAVGACYAGVAGIAAGWLFVRRDIAT